MLARSLKFLFSNQQPNKHLPYAELMSQMTHTREYIKKTQTDIEQLKKQLHSMEKHAQQRNQVIQDKRRRLTEDVKKGEKVWADAKRKSQQHKSQAIQNFAGSLIQLGIFLRTTEKEQKEDHALELRQGFENTTRLFFSTLQKFKIHRLEVKHLAKVNKKIMEVVGEEKSENEEEKGRVAKVVEDGWQIEGKAVYFPKVIVYV